MEQPVAAKPVAKQPSRWLRSRMTRFLVLFGVFVTLAALAIRTDWFDRSVLLPYTGFITSLAGGILQTLGVEAKVDGTAILHPSFSVDIRRGCDGMEATLLLVCATLAYPFCSIRRRILTLVSGYVLIFVMNMVRVVGLFLLGYKGFMAAFDFVHTYVAQFAIVTAVMILWLFWISGDRPRKQAAPATSGEADG